MGTGRREGASDDSVPHGAETNIFVLSVVRTSAGLARETNNAAEASRLGRFTGRGGVMKKLAMFGIVGVLACAPCACGDDDSGGNGSKPGAGGTGGTENRDPVKCGGLGCSSTPASEYCYVNGCEDGKTYKFSCDREVSGKGWKLLCECYVGDSDWADEVKTGVSFSLAVDWDWKDSQLTQMTREILTERCGFGPFER